MPQIASYDDVKAHRTERAGPPGHKLWRTNFIVPPQGVLDAPMAFLAEGTPHRVIRPHFHEVDQFQVIVSGGGVIGRHPLALHAVHFARAGTPYGPLVANDQGVGFLTLRAHWDRGAQYLPDARERLEQLPERNPWQVTERPAFVAGEDVTEHPFAQIRDDNGLAAYAVRIAPGAAYNAPDPSATNGQYFVVTRGSVLLAGREYRALTIGFTRANEIPLRVNAGPEGAEALVLHFPRRAAAADLSSSDATGRELRVWQCELCAFMYDEAKGMPEDGIAPGTRWEDVPEDWICPDCAASKSDFQMRVVS